jgi:hypothetical protein
MGVFDCFPRWGSEAEACVGSDVNEAGAWEAWLKDTFAVCLRLAGGCWEPDLGLDNLTLGPLSLGSSACAQGCALLASCLSWDVEDQRSTHNQSI